MDAEDRKAFRALPLEKRKDAVQAALEEMFYYRRLENPKLTIDEFIEEVKTWK